MIEVLKEAVERAAQQSEEEQAVIAAIIMRTLDIDTRWEALLADPLTPRALDRLAAESIAEDGAGQTQDISGDDFLS
jgi:hypothetical protein